MSGKCDLSSIWDFQILDLQSINPALELTVYRASGIVETLKEISNNIEQSRLHSIAEVFTILQKSGRDDLLSLELAICDIFIDHRDKALVVPIIDSDIEVW